MAGHFRLAVAFVVDVEAIDGSDRAGAGRLPGALRIAFAARLVPLLAIARVRTRPLAVARGDDGAALVAWTGLRREIRAASRGGVGHARLAAEQRTTGDARQTGGHRRERGEMEHGHDGCSTKNARKTTHTSSKGSSALALAEGRRRELGSRARTTAEDGRLRVERRQVFGGWDAVEEEDVVDRAVEEVGVDAHAERRGADCRE